MKWIGERVSFVDDKSKTTVVIYPENVFWVKGAMGAWVAMWYAIGAIMIWAWNSLKLTQQEFIIIGIFMTFWAYYAVRVARTFFWLLWGKELIKLDERAFIYKRSIRSFGKAVPYYFENIKKVTLIVPEERSIQQVWESSPWIQGGERIVFDYLGKQVKLARKLNSKDAELLFKFLTKKIEDRLKKIND